jgi:N-formylglutamate amidohydrolase
MAALPDPTARHFLPDKTVVPWVVIHLPHAARDIPADLRPTFLLDDNALERELDRMTDHYTDELFSVTGLPVATVRFPVSRFVVDPERFEDDADEPMAQRGQGVIYTRTSAGQALRHTPTPDEREALLDRFYRPHHAQLAQRVGEALAAYAKALVIDGHSFPDRPLPMEFDQRPDRPDICLGTDPSHTPNRLVEALVEACRQLGCTVRIHAPYAGTIVPRSFLRQDPRVHSVLIEVNRRLYLAADAGQAQRGPGFETVQRGVGALVRVAAEAVGLGESAR